MQKLYGYALCPFSRAVRFYFAERGIEFELIDTNPWDDLERFKNNDLCIDIPVLEDVGRDKSFVSGFYPIVQFFDEGNHMNRLVGVTTKEHLEVLRICEKFNSHFYADVSRPIIYEKVTKRYYNNRSPNSTLIRESVEKMKEYMGFIGWLFERRNWLAGEEFSLADIVAASHLSCLDYLGVINWSDCVRAKDWYMRVKSRPAFRGLLFDKVRGIPQSENYAELDF